MFGDDILFAPCFKANGEVGVYLPEGDWQQLNLDNDEGRTFKGGRYHELTLKLNEMAAFVAKGKQIPLNKEVSSTAELGLQTDGLFEVDRLWPT